MNFLKLAATIIGATSILVSACKKDDEHHTMLNINYPAAYIVNGSSNNISVVSLSDNRVKETIALNGATFPHHIYINPAKTKLAVAITNTDLSGGHADHGGSVSGLKIQIVDATTGMIDKEIALSKMPHNAIFNANGTELWLGQMDTTQSQVLVYKTSDWSLQNTINVGKGLSEITFSSDATMAFAANTSEGTVTVIDVNSKMVRTTLTVGQDPVGAWPAANGYMYVDNEKSQSVTEISVSEAKVVSTFDLGFKPGYVAYSTHHNEIWVTDATNGKVIFFKNIAGVWTPSGNLATGADAHAIAFSNNGEKAYITNQGANTVSVVDVVKHTKIQDIGVGNKPNGVALKQ